MNTAKLITGDVREVLPTLPDESVQCVVTSPPYFGLRDYGVDGQMGLEQSPTEYVAGMVAVFREVKRVLRPDGTLWLNLGDSYAGSGKGRNADGSHQEGGKQGTSRGTIEGLLWKSDTGKPKDLVGIPWKVAFALQDDGWYLRSDIIWCLSGGTRVYAKTQKGEMPMSIKDMVRLDPATVQLWNGEKWTQVLGWNESTEARNALEIELRSGQRIGCTAGHQWPTQRGLVRTDELQRGDVIQTTTLPEPAEPESPNAIPDDFGYIAGLYLAEGSLDSRGRIQIAGHVSQHDARMATLSYLRDDFGASINGYALGNKSTIVINSPVVLAMLRLYIYGDNARTKGLTSAAWRRSNDFLSYVLHGYLAGDAHYDEANDRYRLGFTRNDRWAADLRTIAARLDLPLRLAATTATGFGVSWPIYRGDFRWTRSEHFNARTDSQVVAVRPGRGRKFWDIGVADEPHTFALASGVLTHNSKPNPMPESVRDRPTRAHEYLFLLTKSARYFYDAEAIREPNSNPELTECVTHWRDRPGNGEWPSGVGGRMGSVQNGRNKRTVWTIATQPFSQAHFAVFPEALVEPCILAGSSERGCCPECGAPWRRVVEREVTGRRHVSPKDANPNRNDGPDEPTSRLHSQYFDYQTLTTGWEPTCTHDAEPAPCTVLDPFSGAGTVGVVALRQGRNYIGVELNSEYVEMSRRRIHGDAPLMNVVEVAG